MPRIAISVDLLDTGIDVPEVVNLVFVKPVHSLIKMQQMIRRGTRSNDACRYFHRLPNGHKDEFLIIDFWENEFDKDPSEETVTQDLPVTVKIFNTRLKLLELYLDNQESADCQQLDGGCYITEADLLANEGISIPMEAHNESDFVIRIRYGRGQMRKLEIKPDRNISIVAPGGWKISGLRMQ